MELTDMDREWVADMAGHPVSDQEVIEFLKEYNDWIDETEASLEISPEIYGGT